MRPPVGSNLGQADELHQMGRRLCRSGRRIPPCEHRQQRAFAEPAFARDHERIAGRTPQTSATTTTSTRSRENSALGPCATAVVRVCPAPLHVAVCEFLQARQQGLATNEIESGLFGKEGLDRLVFHQVGVLGRRRRREQVKLVYERCHPQTRINKGRPVRAFRSEAVRRGAISTSWRTSAGPAEPPSPTTPECLGDACLKPVEALQARTAIDNASPGRVVPVQQRASIGVAARVTPNTI